MYAYKSKKIISFVILLLTTCLFSCPVYADSEKSSDETAFFETECNAEMNSKNVFRHNTFEESIRMSDKEALQLYDRYCMVNSGSHVETPKDSVKCLDNFVKYAARHGIIKNTPSQRRCLSKAVVRAKMKIVASAGKLIGLKTSAMLLKHSLQDSPSNISFGCRSTYASQIQSSSEFKKILKDFKKKSKSKKVTNRKYSGSTVLNSTADLHLAYNKVSYSLAGSKKNGKWTVVVKFADTYDFAMIP